MLANGDMPTLVTSSLEIRRDTYSTQSDDDRSDHQTFIFFVSVDGDLDAGAGWHTPLAKFGLQSDLGCKTGAVHGKDVCWRGTQAAGEKIDGGLDAGGKLRSR